MTYIALCRLAMPKHEHEDGVIRTFARTFQDVYLERSRNTFTPFVEDKTAQSHLYRIIDLMDSEIGEAASPHALSKELILTLLQCAARLYEGDVHAREATDLIKCKEFQTILSVGIQDKLAQGIHERCIATIRSEEPTGENRLNASLLSAKRENSARQLGNKTILIEHIASLCYSQPNTLKNVCESARIDEPFMFRNYTTLVGPLSLPEKSWLVSLLPHIFQWAEGTCEDTKASCYKLVARYGVPSPDSVVPYTLAEADPISCGDDNASDYGSFSPLRSSPNFDWGFLDEDDATQLFRLSPDPCNNASTNRLVPPPPSHDTGMVTKKLQDRITPATTQSIQTAFTFVDPSKAAFVDKEAQKLPATYHSFDAPVDRELLQLFANMRLRVWNAHRIQKKMLQMFDDPAPRQGWLKILQKSTIEYHSLATVAAFISVLKTAIETSDGEAEKKQQTLSTIPEGSLEHTDPEERSKGEENEADQVEIKTTDLPSLELACAVEEKTK